MFQKRLRDIIIILLILIVAKFGINYCYENDMFSLDHIKYTHYVNSLEAIDSEQLNDLVNQTQDEINIVYMGRKTCPVCVKLLPQISTVFETYNQITLNGTKNEIYQYYFDSEKNQTALAKQIREKIGANTVPVIIIIKDGNITLFDSDSLILSDYLEEFERQLTL